MNQRTNETKKTILSIFINLYLLKSRKEEKPTLNDSSELS